MAMEFNIFAHKRASLKLRELHDGKGKPDSVCMLPNLLLAIGWARLQQCVNRELPDVQAGFRKGRGTRDQIANIRWIIEKARELLKNISFRIFHS